MPLNENTEWYLQGSVRLYLCLLLTVHLKHDKSVTEHLLFSSVSENFADELEF